MEKVLGPGVLFAKGGKGAPLPLERAHNALRAEAVHCGMVNKWWQGKPQVRTQSLVWEDEALPWRIEWERRVLGMAAKLRLVAEKGEGSVVGQKVAQGSMKDKFSGWPGR